MKITEIKVMAGKDVFILSPKSMEVVISGRTIPVDDKLAAKLFKAVAEQAEKWFGLLKKP
ncbi:MAG: hypothetical protein ACREYE_22260 [Gammaproteobacteria bacterium]